MDLTLIIIIITTLASIAAFESPRIFDRLLLSPYMIVHRNEWYRVITHGFIHANWMHLLINMFVFYSFGQALMAYFTYYVGNAMIHFLVIYFGGMIFATLTTIMKNRNNYAYRGIGASGAVSAVLFACIFFDPWRKLLFMGIIPVPGIIFAILYLVYCSYMSRNSNDNINHDAHLYGAIFGFIYPVLIKPDLFQFFITDLMNPFGQ
ncbi:MAG: rhomboid family intramembrane serine protease [Prevotellaceae bacterium]|jgi:membrane associated rhomboid family serine protease|nr:rhomboid family intramembrane serine protease [Prevotellaceae bacterium]